MLLLHIRYHSGKQEEIKYEFSFGEIESALWTETKRVGSQRENHPSECEWCLFIAVNRNYLALSSGLFVGDGV